MCGEFGEVTGIIDLETHFWQLAPSFLIVMYCGRPHQVSEYTCSLPRVQSPDLSKQIYPAIWYTKMRFDKDPNSRFFQSSVVHKDVVCRIERHQFARLSPQEAFKLGTMPKRGIEVNPLTSPYILAFYQRRVQMGAMQFLENPASAQLPQLSGIWDPSTHKHKYTGYGVHHTSQSRPSVRQLIQDLFLAFGIYSYTKTIPHICHHRHHRRWCTFFKPAYISREVLILWCDNRWLQHQ